MGGSAGRQTPPLTCVSTACAAKAVHLASVSTTVAAKTPPLPGVSTAAAATTMLLPCVFNCHCLVCSTACAAETAPSPRGTPCVFYLCVLLLPLPCVFHCLRG